VSPVGQARRDQGRAGKVLVVDDEPAEREGLARLVGQWGYEVETASSGEEALDLIESQHPAVVLTDLVLPEMDGLTLLQKLKETGRPPIVLLVTGHGTVETAVEAMRNGAFDYLTKPVDATRLQVLLEKSIEQESLSREVSFLRHAGSSWRRPAPPPWWSTARAGRARSSWPAPSTTSRTGAAGRSWPSTARRSPRRSSRASCSATSAAPSPGRPSGAWDASS
jgi:CheY-like chemotaxis protein